MITEMKITNELNKRYTTQYETNLYYMKVLNSIVRLPRMADQFYKAMKRSEAPDTNKERENFAIRSIRPYIAEGTENQFFNKLITYLESTFRK